MNPTSTFPQRRRLAFPCQILVLALAACALPAIAAVSPHASALHDMSRAFEAITSRVSPAVVEVLVSGYGTVDPESHDPGAPISRQRSLGSGVIVDPNGYIVTNYHVVKWAQRVNVVLTPAVGPKGQAAVALRSRARVLPARIVGYSSATDLAVLKVDATGLPTVSFAKYNKLRQGQVVLAIGNPMGLKNSVSLGLVSSVVRQNSPDSPMVYIQTDAAINPGNSGGALVDADGDLVGINASILTESGGNEGIGFAIPSGIVQYVYRQIRQYGYVHGGSIGAQIQGITPRLAAALQLPSDHGVIVSDIAPGGPAASAGLRPFDRIVSIDGHPVDSVPTAVMNLYMRKSGDHVRLGVERGDRKLSLTVPVVARHPIPQSLVDLANLDTGRVAQLGVIATDLTPQIAGFLQLRNPDESGVVVAAIIAGSGAAAIGLQAGDIIESLDANPLKTVAQLKAALRGHKPGDPVVLRVDRDGRATLVTFDIE